MIDILVCLIKVKMSDYSPDIDIILIYLVLLHLSIYKGAVVK